MLRKSFLQHLSQNMNLILTCYLCMHGCAFEILDQTFFCKSFFHMDHITVLSPTPSRRSIQSPTFCLQWCVWMVSISNADVFHIGAGTPLCAITPIHESDAECCQFSPDLVRASIILCFSCSSSLLQSGCQICFC